MQPKLSEIVEILQPAKRPTLDGDVLINGVSTDSRQLTPGCLFVALRGESFDGHNFLVQAENAGAAALLAEEAVDGLSGKVPLILVPDTLEALGKLALAWRLKFPTVPVAAIVGSSGKTTTKEMSADIVSRYRRALVTRGNLNNLIGLPQTMFQMSGSHEAAVLELGMNVPDENRRLVEMCLPDLILLTNITHAHIGMFESARAHFEAEAEPLRFAGPQTKLAVNIDDPLSVQAVEEYWQGRPLQTFSATSSSADVYAENVRQIRPFGYSFDLRSKAGESASVELKMFGRHNVANAVAAAVVGLFFGISLEESAAQLSLFQPRLNRSEVEELDGWYLVKDYYNAIPAAVKLALESLKDVHAPGRRYAVLGDMMELGDFEEQYHLEVGTAAAKAGLDHLFTLGERGRIIHGRAVAEGLLATHFADAEALAVELRSRLRPGDVLLVKGSRALKLERLYQLLKTPAAVAAN